MTKVMKLLLGVALSFMFVTLCIGYAQLSDTLTVSGTVNVKAQEGVFIYNITGTSNFSVTGYRGTLLNGTATTNNGTVTIKFYNNSAYDYVFNGAEPYGNTSISVTTEKDSYTTAGKTIKAGEYFELKATYENAQNVAATVNYEFVLASDYVDKAATDGALGRFLEILNTQDTYSTFMAALDNKYKGGAAWTATYIGNVTGSYYDDTAQIENLFGDYLTLDTANGEVNITLIAKLENLDGNDKTGITYKTPYNNTEVTIGTGCELTLYMTTQDLINDWRYGQDAWPIYAVVFTCNNEDGTYTYDGNTNTSTSGKWYQVGGMYTGQAEVVTYAGDGTESNGSFNTGDWKSIESYTFNNTTIGSDASIKTIIQAYIQAYGYTAPS